MELFFRDISRNIMITWDQLLNDLGEGNAYNPYCMSTNYYHVFRHIITSMLSGDEIILLDGDFTDDELVKLTGFHEFGKFVKPVDKTKFPIPGEKQKLIEQLRNTNNSWKITLFTSGTTGLPKKVTHNFNSITRFVKFFENSPSSVWGFAYNPTHMAGIQVFLQALLNGNSIVKLFGLSSNDIHHELMECRVTHISATPSFYRLLLPCEISFPYVERITSGGEIFDKGFVTQMGNIFPKAKINNIYASTEAGTLFTSYNDIFTIKPEYENFIKVDHDELLIHKSFIGQSDILLNEWYNTGDIIEILANDPIRFRFLTRKSDMINVGGYKVNPIEVEEAILLIPGIKDVRVFPRSNSVLGKLICCEIVCNDELMDEAKIRRFLQSKLQEFKIPRMIHFVHELTRTRTGKIKRT